VIETSHVTKNPQRECITLDRTLPAPPQACPSYQLRSPHAVPFSKAMHLASES